MAAAPWILSGTAMEACRAVAAEGGANVSRFPRAEARPDRQALQDLFVLHNGIAWRHVPLEFGLLTRKGARSTTRR
jgi:hypothetical protein